MVQIPSAGMSQIYITSCMQLSVPDSCISSIKVHMIERLRCCYSLSIAKEMDRLCPSLKNIVPIQILIIPPVQYHQSAIGYR